MYMIHILIVCCLLFQNLVRAMFLVHVYVYSVVRKLVRCRCRKLATSKSIAKSNPISFELNDYVSHTPASASGLKPRPSYISSEFVSNRIYNMS